MLEESTTFAAHVLHQILRYETEILLDLLNETIAVFEIQMPETENLLQIVRKQLPTHVQTKSAIQYRLMACLTGAPSK